MTSSDYCFSDIYRKSTVYLLQRLEKHFFQDFSFEGKKILDVGCWWGWFIKYARDRDSIVYGFDIDKDRIADASKFIGVRGLCIADAVDMPFKTNCFDLVFSWHVLEHIEESNKMLSEVYRVLKKEGTLILGVPNDYNFAILPYRCFRFLLNKKKSFLKEFNYYNFIKSLAYSDIGHKREYTKKSIRQELKDNDFEIKYIVSYGLDLPFPLRNVLNRRQRAFIQYKLDLLFPSWFRAGFIAKAHKK